MLPSVKNFLENILVVDTESTGIDPMQAELVEVAAAKYLNGNWYARSFLIRPQNPIPFAASYKNNISNRMVANQYDLKDSLPNIKQLFEMDNSQSVYVAHNFVYDKTILTQQLASVGARDESEHIKNSKWICTQRLAQHLLAPDDATKYFQSFAQNYLRFSLDLNISEEIVAHRAENDVKICAILLVKLIDIIVENNLLTPQEQQDSNFDWASFLSDLCQLPITYPVFPLGKHGGEPFDKIPTDYLKWAASNMDMLNPDNSAYNADLANTVYEQLIARGVL